MAIVNREKPLCDVPEIGIGNKPIDGGNYLFTPEEKAEFLKTEPKAKKVLPPLAWVQTSSSTASSDGVFG